MKPVISPKDRLLSIDELDRDIVNLSSRINAATFELLVLVRQFDERAGWLQWGLNNCADWLAWRCDLSMSAAREKVRVAHALKTLPMIATSFSTGEVSYSKVRPLTRVASMDNEESWLVFAVKTRASGGGERCRERGNGRGGGRRGTQGCTGGGVVGGVGVGSPPLPATSNATLAAAVHISASSFRLMRHLRVRGQPAGMYSMVSMGPPVPVRSRLEKALTVERPTSSPFSSQP